MAPTICVPNKSARYAGAVEKPPPYIDKMMQTAPTNNAMLPALADHGRLTYSTKPRPKKSEHDAQTKRPPILNKLIKPVKPAAIAAMAAFCSTERSLKPTLTPSKWPPNTSCNIGEEMPITPIPADTFRHSTSHTSQNCGMPQTFFTCTWFCVIMVLLVATGAVQPAGFQPLGGTR